MDKIELEKAIKFTAEQQIKKEVINQCKSYLEKTRHKFESDYELKEDEDLETIKAKRSEARKFIRDNK